ncbi:MAG TPA: GldM family protein, partial [Anseongella sp.]|nr:GldM family protein [Anseongella sp.]
EKGARKWEHIMFESVPATAGLTILSKLQTDAKNAEVEVSRYLLTAINATDFKFDVLEPAVVAPTSYVLTGQPYEAQIFLTASNSTQQPDVVVNGQRLPVQGNKAIFSSTHSSPGVYEYSGAIRVQGPDGSVKEYPFSQSYQVSAPTAVVSADKMNVLYIGVDNPISVSVPGIPRESIRASINSGSLSGGNGNYVARVSQAGTAVISVSAEVGGEMRALGSQTFRVRTVPPPIPKFGGINSGALSASVAKVQPGVFAVLENFDFDMKFTVTRFTLIISRRRSDPFVQTASSNALTPQMKQALNTLTAGDVIAIDDIYVKGGDGTNRKLESGIAIRIQ